MVYVFFDEVKKGSWQLEKILESWDAGQEVAVASFFLCLKYPGHDPRVQWLSSSRGLLGPARAVAMVLAVGQVVVLGSDLSSSVCKS